MSAAPFGGREAVIVQLSHGTKLAVKIVSLPGLRVRVWSWRNNSGEWTNPQTIHEAKIVGPADPKDRRYRAAAARWLPDGSGPLQRRVPCG